MVTDPLRAVSNIHEYAVPIIYILGGVGFLVGIYNVSQRQLRDIPKLKGHTKPLKWILLILSAMFWVSTICMLFNNLWALAVNWEFFALMGIAAALSTDYIMSYFAGIVNMIGFFQATATVYIIRGDYNVNIIDFFDEDSCRQYFMHALSDDGTADNKCGNDNYLGFLRVISIFYIIALFAISYLCFLFGSLQAKAATEYEDALRTNESHKSASSL